MTKPPSSASAIELLQNHSLATLVRSELERRILVGEIAPGAKLAEADIAGELNVSRGPVREAFRALEQAGLVRTEKNRGVFVREVSLQEADEIYEVRAGLDELIGRLAAQRITAAQLADLRELLRKMQQAARLKSVDDYYPLNLRFHALLAGFAGNRTLEAVYGRLVNELHLYRRETLARGANSFPDLDARARRHRRCAREARRRARRAPALRARDAEPRAPSRRACRAARPAPCRGGNRREGLSRPAPRSIPKRILSLSPRIP